MKGQKFDIGKQDRYGASDERISEFIQGKKDLEEVDAVVEKMVSKEAATVCPQCGSPEIGYAVSLHSYDCAECGHVWK
jgi:hypothetical protein